MTTLAYVLLTAATSVAPMPSQPVEPDAPVELVQIMIRQTVIIRPLAPSAPPPRPIQWKEVKGPKCVPLASLAGWAVTQSDSLDVLLRTGARLRIQLDDECPALDYYQGLYLNPTADGQVCSRRDAIHTRAGGECGIRKIRSLVPKR